MCRRFNSIFSLRDSRHRSRRFLIVVSLVSSAANAVFAGLGKFESAIAVVDRFTQAKTRFTVMEDHGWKTGPSRPTLQFMMAMASCFSCMYSSNFLPLLEDLLNVCWTATSVTQNRDRKKSQSCRVVIIFEIGNNFLKCKINRNILKSILYSFVLCQGFLHRIFV